jgi:hypothetical protein
MAMSDTPRALASRLEEASGGSRELDREIFVALEPEKASQRCYAGELEGNVAAYMTPYYTVSLDAALALVERKLPGWSWRIGNRPGGGAWVLLGTSREEHLGATPALALLLALVKALSQGGQNHE